ncbi:MAG: protein kinase domain-containing protein [Planctomycetota bacterium]|jgi:serine/threonine protein kinase/formylglycine-generating enzyme required for sulfatase activity
MSDIPVNIPESYELVKTISTSDMVSEYIVRHRTEDILLRLKIFSFSTASGVTVRRHSREHLRSDITFLEELELSGIIRVFDYSDSKNQFWIATQPAEIDKLSECFDFLVTQSVEFRQNLVHQFLAVLQRIHECGVVHRNISGHAVFLTPKHEIYIGDFGLASHLTEQPTIRMETTLVTITSYLPPEVRSADTLICNVNSDIFSAGLLVFEILSATPLPQDSPDQIIEILKALLNEQVDNRIINRSTADVILKAANLSPEKRWSTAEDFANALKASEQDKSVYQQAFADQMMTMAITNSTESAAQTSDDHTTEIAPQPSKPEEKAVEAVDAITPLDSSHEVWNNHYEILEKIGEGGQAVVYKAYDHLTNEEIAIKTIWSRHRGDRAAINRLKQGAMIARSLTHRHIIKTYSVEQRTDADSAGKYVFICMELVGSKLDLAHVIETRKNTGTKIRLDETLHIIHQLLDALMYAHEYTIHRDIKPGNIMLVPRDKETGNDISDLTKFNIKLIDFGIAKVLSQKHIDVTGKGFRSAYYGAPELADTHTGVDARADIYSVGVILYQMLTRNIPRKGSAPANKVNKDVPAALAKVIDRTISTDREQRFKTISEFIKEINRAVSKFNWVRKAAKVAAVLLIVVCAAAAVKYFLPEKERLPVRQSMELLQDRDPNAEIASLATASANASIVRYSDIEGYNSYNSLRANALDNLKILENAGNDTFDEKFSTWRDQEEEWQKIEPAIGKIERIAADQHQYNARREKLPIINHLKELKPSSEIVSKVTEKAQTAETLLEARPIAQNTLDLCAESYYSAANVYMNIQKLAGDSDTSETAERINLEFKNVGQLREASLFSRTAIEEVEQLNDSGFHERSTKCFNKADDYYNTFELQRATQYYNLLSQICGTMAYVQDQIDFSRSRIGLISSRLMELCYEDVGTFENYPDWKVKLEHVYKNKDIAAKYTLIRGLLVKSPRDVPSRIYNLVRSALQQYRQNNLDSAAADLIGAIEQYKSFMHQKINTLIADCESLSTFSTVPAEKIENCKNALEKLSNSIIESPWPQADFADEYNRYSQQVIQEKKDVRKQLTENAQQLRKSIVDSKNRAQQSFFWESRNISKYISVAQQYDNDDIEDSIANWQYVEDLSRLSVIINQMKTIDSLLDNMLLRKDKLDRLAVDIDEAIAFCQKFKSVSPEEKEKYEQFGADLTQLRLKLTVPQDDIYLIDQADEAFTAQYGVINSAFLEIHAKLPYHRNRVIELINKTHSLEQQAGDISRLHQHWRGIFADSISLEYKSDFTQTRDYLESIKDDVDNWPPEQFNRQMRERCNVLADALHKQGQMLASITSAVIDEKLRLLKEIESFRIKVNTILSDEDIRTLEVLAATDERQSLRQFRQMPNQLEVSRQKLTDVTLESDSASADSLLESTSADFEINGWLVAFNKRYLQLDNQIVQLQAIQNTALMFQEIRELLAKQSSIETEYYTGLRDYTVGLIDYSDVNSKIDAVANDSASVKMCEFLEQMEDDTVPGLTAIKAIVSEITDELADLTSTKINTLTEAKDFNNKRLQLLKRITALRQNIQKLDRTNIENTCKEAIVSAVDNMKNLIDSSSQADKLNKLTTSLWKFYPEHRDWEQWLAFLQLHHITVSDEDISLTSFSFLRPVNKNGDYLKLPEITANPTKIFNFSTTNSTNFGWPFHVSHQKDPTVIFAFIPGESSTSTGPFYMAIREITNAQYILFMQKTGAKSPRSMTGWTHFTDEKGNTLILQIQGQFPPSRITWDKATSTFVLDKNFENAPVTWVTSNGAGAYAKWFDAQLPTIAQHSYAARGGTNTRYPWGDELSGAPSYAHIRSIAWQKAARDYNSKRDDPVKISYAPVGAIQDYVRGEALDPAAIAHAENNDHPAWPYFTKNNKPNAWDLYDMLGNVWEWCTDIQNNSEAVICGGSCLSPPEYISPDSKYEFEALACDVGFRIVITLK